MSADLRYDQERNILHVILHGLITVDQLRNILHKITHAEEYPPDIPALWDLTAVDAGEVDLSMIEKFIGTRERFPERGITKLAILTSSELAFGLSRMYEAMSVDLPQTIRVFKDRATAEQWLQEQDPS